MAEGTIAVPSSWRALKRYPVPWMVEIQRGFRVHSPSFCLNRCTYFFTSAELSIRSPHTWLGGVSWETTVSWLANKFAVAELLVNTQNEAGERSDAETESFL